MSDIMRAELNGITPKPAIDPLVKDSTSEARAVARVMVRLVPLSIALTFSTIWIVSTSPLQSSI